MSNHKKKSLSHWVSATILAGFFAGAQAANLQGIVGKTVVSHPDILAKWHQFRATEFERDTSSGRYLPTLDILFGTGYQKQESPLFTERHYNFQSTKATLRQNLFEGFATQNDVKRLEHASMVRFYEVLDLSESAALEAARAYIDVWRYRRLVEFAEENYATHRLIYEKIQQRTQAGVGRRVDLETAAGRLALAESNLLTETSNLHDVSARYQRIVGSLPEAELDPPPAVLAKHLPKDREESIRRGFERSPQLKAALENILSAKRNVEVQKAGNYPRVDAYIEAENGRNLNGYNTSTGYPTGQTNNQTVGLTFSWNIFRGNQDISRQRRAAEESNVAKDQRETVCRNLRQNLAMAFNDHLRLSEQLQYLDQHQLSTDKAREAFRRQFDIGQRTLLDVLDTENEFYTARRNYLNGEMDLEVARARYLATSGGLLKALDLQPIDISALRSDPPTDEDLKALCPAEPPVSYIPKKEVAPERFVVLPEADGKVGEIFVKTDAGKEVRIKEAYAAAQVSAAGVDLRQMTEEEVKQRYGQLIPVEPQLYVIRFALGKATPLPASRSVLKAALDECLSDPGARIFIVGHADKLGSAKQNMTLSKARAEAVRNSLMAGGVQKERIESSWFGDEKPLPETVGHIKDERNRRVEIRLE